MRDNAPIGNTCPMINNVIDVLNNLDSYDVNNSDELLEMQSEVKKGIEILEQIRSANSDLREWGNDLYCDKEDLEKENDNLKDEVSELQSKISQLESEIDEIQIELDNVQY